MCWPSFALWSNITLFPKSESCCSRSFVYAVRQGTAVTNELRAKVEKYERNAAECEIIAQLAAQPAKRELYARLALHCREVAVDLKKLTDVRSVA
jgi:hypothetical protein